MKHLSVALVGLMLALGGRISLAQQAGLLGVSSPAEQPPAAIESRWTHWQTAQTGVPAGFPVGLPQVPQELPAPQTSPDTNPSGDRADAPAASQAAADDEAGSASESGAESEEESEEPDLAKRVEELEKSIKKQAEQEAKKKEDAAKKPTFQIGGRIHLDHWAFSETSRGIDYFENPNTGDDPEDRLLFRRIRLEMQGNVFETMLYRMQIDFNNPAVAEMKDVYLGFQELPYNQTLTFGNQKRPLGLDHLNSSRFNIFAERPLVVEAFNEDARRLGVLMSGFTDAQDYNWQYGVFNLENLATTGRYIGDSLQMSGNARLAGSPWYDETSDGRGYFHWAVAGMVAKPDGDVGPNDSNNNEGRFRTRPEMRSSTRWIDTGPIAGADWYEILGLEAMLNIGPFQVTSEYQSNWLQRDSAVVGNASDLHFHGAYVYISYFLTGEHMAYERDSGTLGRVKPLENFFLVDRCRGGTGHGWGAWQTAIRYSYLDLSDDNVRGGVENNITYDLNWYWTSHSKLQFNALYGDIDNHRPVGGFTSGHFTGFGTRFMVDF